MSGASCRWSVFLLCKSSELPLFFSLFLPTFPRVLAFPAFLIHICTALSFLQVRRRRGEVWRKVANAGFGVFILGSAGIFGPNFRIESWVGGGSGSRIPKGCWVGWASVPKGSGCNAYWGEEKRGDHDCTNRKRISGGTERRALSLARVRKDW